MRISDWSSDVCSSDLIDRPEPSPASLQPGLEDRSRAIALENRSIGPDEDGRAAEPVRSGKILIRIEARSEEHTSALQSLMRISSAVFGLKKQNYTTC